LKFARSRRSRASRRRCSNYGGSPARYRPSRPWKPACRYLRVCM